MSYCFAAALVDHGLDPAVLSLLVRCHLQAAVTFVRDKTDPESAGC